MKSEDMPQTDTITSLSNSPSNVDHFMLLAKKATSVEDLLSVIYNCLEATGVSVFSELLELQPVKNLQQGPHEKYFNTLNLFAFGTFREYLSNKDSLLELSPVMVKKLQHLTIVSMFIRSGKCIPYSTLMKELQINSVRELEDLIIDSLSSNIIQGKLDQKNEQLEVDNAIGRDIKPEDLNEIVDTLEDWCDSCETVLVSIEDQIKRANAEKQTRLKHKDLIEQEIINLKKAIKAQSNETDEMLVGDSREASSVHEIRKKPSTKSKKASGSTGVRLQI